MTRARELLATTLLLACTPHEHAREPSTPCAAGMIHVDGSPPGAPFVAPLCVDHTEVTTAEYGACVHAGKCEPAVLDNGEDCNLTQADRRDHPVNCVTFDQAQAHCAWLGKRLPGNDEWTWFARPRARGAVYPWNDAHLDDARACIHRGNLGTCKVGERPTGASGDGILDLAGNVSEWVVDGDAARFRGGSWRDVQPDLDFPPPPRDHTRPYDPSPGTGFRCVVAPFTPVETPDRDVWVPHRPGLAELPVLAAPVPRDRPARPLANLTLLHALPERRSPLRWWPVDGGFIGADPSDPARLGLADPIDPTALPEAIREFTPVRRLGDTILMTAGWSANMRFIAVEPATAKIRWQLAFAKLGTSYEQFVAPRTLVAEFYGEGTDMLLGFGLVDGREVWRMRGGPNAPFTRIKHIWQDDDRGYLHGDRSLLAFDTTTGAILWTVVGPGDPCGIAGDEGALIIEEPGRYRRLDPATGAELSPIASGFTECTWNGSWPVRLPPGVVEADHFFVFQPLKGDAVELQAIDLATGAVRWRRSGLDAQVLLADRDAVYVMRGEHLVALDAATGTTSAEISLGLGATNFTVHGGVGERGPLLVAIDNGEWILGRAEQPPVPESFRVRGRLVPDGVGRGQVANVRVRVGERRVRTDADGRFEVRGRAIGALAVDLGTDRGPNEPGGSRVRFDPVTVVLDGRGNYDVGDISLYPWYVE